jgi:hypothetical protein
LLDKDMEKTPSESGSVSGGPTSKKKEKMAEKHTQPPAPPPVPEIPKPKTLPCAICREMAPLGDQHLSCKECRLTVHRSCYGVIDNRASNKWTCDMCLNDKNPQLSIVSAVLSEPSKLCVTNLKPALQMCSLPGRTHGARLCRAPQSL